MRTESMKNIREVQFTYRQQDMPAKKQVYLSEELIAEFLKRKQKQGCSTGTLYCYRNNLKRLYRYLP